MAAQPDSLDKIEIMMGENMQRGTTRSESTRRLRFPEAAWRAGRNMLGLQFSEVLRRLADNLRTITRYELMETPL